MTGLSPFRAYEILCAALTVIVHMRNRQSKTIAVRITMIRKYKAIFPCKQIHTVYACRFDG